MKVTKQTLYKKEWAYRPLAMDVLVALVRDGSTKQTVESFRLKWRISLPGERDRLAQKMPRILFGGAFRKDGMKRIQRLDSAGGRSSGKPSGGRKAETGRIGLSADPVCHDWS